MEKIFFAVWIAPGYENHVAVLKPEHINEDAGYSTRDVLRIKSLEERETWQSSDRYHFITRLPQNFKIPQ